MNRRQFGIACSGLALAGCGRRDARVVLYSAQDREFAEALLSDFERDAGLRVDVKYDTEAQKTVGLARELEAETDRPRADVFWNNEPINTIRLQRVGVLEPYASPTAADFPDWARPADKTWQAFAARGRVLIVNTQIFPREADRPKSLFDLTDPKWKGKVAMAKPQFGTTATQAACLFDVLGTDGAKDYYRGLKSNDVQLVAGNKQVATGVSEGRFAFGVTDTDDTLEELNAGKPVALVFPDKDGNKDHPKLGVLYLPNTLALVKGGPNPAGGKKLIDYLLRPETEKRLAAGGGYQIPLNPAVVANLPEVVLRPDKVKRMNVNFEKAADAWEDVQAFLRDLF
jgi:iron(III) transport system substrate-binding protein